MNSRAARIRVILGGFEVGDRVIIFRDTKSYLGQMILHNQGGVPAVIVGVAPHRFVAEDSRHFVEISASAAGPGWGGRWYVHPDDMRLA